jgi:hypothetical protein
VFAAGSVIALPLLVYTAVLGGTTVVIQAQRPAQRLETVKTLRCSFPVVSTGGWEKGTPGAQVTAAKLTVQFEQIDIDESTARSIGQYGAADVVVRLSNGNLHFMQALSSGPVYLTTVFPKETQSGRLQAVHTRHEFTELALPGFTSRPEQYYGECELQP